jgi:hypothetical protein
MRPDVLSMPKWNVYLLSERWIKESEALLKRMKSLSSKEKRDRLEIINSILLALNILERSLHGWRFWVRNLSLISQFSQEELEEIEGTLEKHVRPFIEYDIKATKKWEDKFPQTRVPRGRRRRGEETRSIYI